ncbi:MAG: GNAT family N-acetyltransferase [Dehalococcoidia bacterium]
MVEDDVLACLDLDPGYCTDGVWQLERHDWGDETSLRLRPATLPRPRNIDGFPIEPPLDERLERASLALLLEDAQIVAYILLREDHRCASVDMLVVDQAWRRLGLGARLLGEARDWARRRGYRILEATVEARNYPAIRFLHRQGFTIRGVRDVVGRDDEVTLILAGSAG